MPKSQDRRKKPLDAGDPGEYLLKELPKYPELQRDLRKAVTDAKHLQTHLNLGNYYQIQVSAFDPKNRKEKRNKDQELHD